MLAHEVFDQFINLFLSTVKKHAPLKKASRREKKLKSKPWLTPSLIKSIRYKNKLFKNIMRHYDMEKFDDYKRFRSVLYRAIKKAKRNYYNDLVLDNKNNSNKLWKIICCLSNIKIKRQSPPKKLHDGDGNVLLNGLHISYKLNSFFCHNK